MFNIGMLKRVFAPTFQLHDIKQTGDYEVTTRWTMSMQFTLTRGTPISRYWDPKLVFSGVSIMGINPSNGAIPLSSPNIYLERGVEGFKYYHPGPARLAAFHIYLRVRGTYERIFDSCSFVHSLHFTSCTPLLAPLVHSSSSSMST